MLAGGAGKAPPPFATSPYHLSPRRRTLVVDAAFGRSRTLTAITSLSGFLGPFRARLTRNFGEPAAG